MADLEQGDETGGLGVAPPEDLEDRRLRSAVKQGLFGRSADPVKVGRFSITKRLGAGGMGVVYEAHDAHLDRSVALKLLHFAGEAEGTKGRARLLREARALAKLSHPNVVAVHEAGIHQGRVYLAMELVRGQSIKAWLAEERRDWTEVLGVMLKAGEGIAAAHAAGLVHRDIKPENILLATDGAVKVLDFGLASGPEIDMESATLSDAEKGEDADVPVGRLTRTGAVMGTPAYMAPEQHLGRPSNASSDQFAFAVSLWEGLYGERPFKGETHAELVASLGRGVGDPPRSQVPRSVAKVLVRALHAEPGRRFPSMRHLLERLGAAAKAGSQRARHALVAVGLSAFVIGLAGASDSLESWFRDDKQAGCLHGRAIDDDDWTAERGQSLATRLEEAGVSGRDAGNAVAALEAFVQTHNRHVAGLCASTASDLAMSCAQTQRDQFLAVAATLEQEPTAVASSIRHVGETLGPAQDCGHIDGRELVFPRGDDAPARIAKYKTLLWSTAGMAGLDERNSAKVAEVTQRLIEHEDDPLGVAEAAYLVQLAQQIPAVYVDRRGLMGGANFATRETEEAYLRAGRRVVPEAAAAIAAEHGNRALSERISALSALRRAQLAEKTGLGDVSGAPGEPTDPVARATYGLAVALIRQGEPNNQAALLGLRHLDELDEVPVLGDYAADVRQNFDPDAGPNLIVSRWSAAEQSGATSHRLAEIDASFALNDVRQGQYDAAIDKLRESADAAEPGPAAITLRIALAEANLAAGRIDDARDEAKQAVSQLREPVHEYPLAPYGVGPTLPRSSVAYGVLGRASAAAGDFEAALEELDTSTKYGGRFVDSAARTVVLARLGMADRADSALVALNAADRSLGQGEFLLYLFAATEVALAKGEDARARDSLGEFEAWIREQDRAPSPLQRMQIADIAARVRAR